MADPVNWLASVSAKYGPTAAGLVIGTAAKYGLTLTEGKPLTWRGVVGDLLLLGMLGLIAIIIADWFDLAGNARVLAGALAAVSSDRLVRLVRDRFLKRIESDLGSAIKAAPEALAIVPPGTGAATSAQLIVHRGADPRTAGVETLAETLLAPPSPEMTGLAGQINAPDIPTT